MLVDSIAGATLEGEGASSELPARTQREIQVLQRLVDASLSALKHSDTASNASNDDGASSVVGSSGDRS